MSADWQADVAEFMRAMGQAVRELPIGSPEDIPLVEENLRIRLIEEELSEFVAAETTQDIADAIADLLYVTVGAACTYGIRLQPIWDEVHRSNMSKADGPVLPGGKRGKGPSYSPPNIEGQLRLQGWEGNS